jgi:hypothetical protein
LFTAVVGVLQFDEHTLRQAAVQIELLRVAPRTLQLHTGSPGDAGNAGNVVHLGGEQLFNSRSAG